jgi:type I restriction enzyme R subunit
MAKRAELTEEYMVEKPAIEWFKSIGYWYIHGSELSPENGERDSYRDVILKRRFLNSIKRINPWLTNSLALEVYKKITDLDHPDFVIKGKIFYEMLSNGVKLTFKERDEEKTKTVSLIDFERPENNEFLVANQFTVEYQYERGMFRVPDIVLFINGIPIAVFELKNFNANETAKDAFYDHKKKMENIPQLYCYAQFVVASDGVETKYGAPTSDWEKFFVWEGIDDDNELTPKQIGEDSFIYVHKKTGEEYLSLEVLIKGLCKKENLLEFLRDFIIYERSGETWTKKIAIYHQFYTVKKAIRKTIDSVVKGKKPEDRRIGVVWHTQGSGKSLTMLFYARKALKQKELENPLLLFITDRKELDEQLYEVFSEMPIAKQAESIKDLQEAIMKTYTGIIFATIQKFGKKRAEDYPFLTDRKNIIVIADEAHRSQYRELARNLRKAIPNASFLGFTATPIELHDRDTFLVFGEPISVYTMDKGIRHKVIVPIYYEARLAELHLTNEFIDEEFEEISEGITEDPEVKESLKKKFAKLESLILAEDRLKKVAGDIVEHFRKRREEVRGKALVVTISRKVAVRLYNKIKEISPDFSVVVVISGSKSKDPEEFHPHIRNRAELEEIAKKFKNPDSEPEMAIVVDMWLTGFDVPCLHTMYFDKPMKGHSLVQAIARVNRVFKDKPGGLIVDYIGIADNLRKSLGLYAVESEKPILTNIEEILDLLKEKYDILSSMFYRIEYKNWTKLSSEEISRLTVAAYERVTRDEEIQKSFLKNFVALKKLYALASPHPETIKMKDDIRFFEMIKKMIVKYSTRSVKDISRTLEYEIDRLISKSISAQEPIDILSLMQKDKIELSVLDDEFLSKFREMEFKNYAVELLAKILRDQILVRMRKNPVRYRSLYEMLNELIKKYNVKLITATEVLEELIRIAKDFRRRLEEGKKVNLTEEEMAFYDLLLSKRISEQDEVVMQIAREIAKSIGNFVKIADWNKKETIKAKIRSSLKTLLPKYMKVQDYRYLNDLSREILEVAEMIYSAV